MKKKFICFAILILTVYILLYPADAVNASRNGLMLWYEKVLPTLLPFAIISNVLIHSGYMDALTKHTATTLGWLSTTPCPSCAMMMVVVPRSIPMSFCAIVVNSFLCCPILYCDRPSPGEGHQNTL